MIGGSEKHNGWLNLELQSPQVIERTSKNHNILKIARHVLALMPWPTFCQNVLELQSSPCRSIITIMLTLNFKTHGTNNL